MTQNNNLDLSLVIRLRIGAYYFMVLKQSTLRIKITNSVIIDFEKLKVLKYYYVQWNLQIEHNKLIFEKKL